MTPTKDPEVFGKAYAFYRSGQYQSAYDLLTDSMNMFEAHKHQFYLWRICMASMLQQPELAEQILTAALQENYFFGESSLRKDSDLRAMQGRPDFEKLVAKDLEMVAAAQEHAGPELILLESVEAHFQRVPLLMALHGNNSTAEQFLGNWNNLSDEGWLVAVPQSSQVSGNGIFSWNNQQTAQKEILDHYAAITEKFSVDQKKSVICGFSMGGYTAIRAALNQYFPIHGVLAIAPYIGEISTMVELLAASPEIMLRFYFLLGQDDEGCTPNALSFRDILVQRGIPCEAEVFPGVGHDFPEDFRTAIRRGLQFISRE